MVRGKGPALHLVAVANSGEEQARCDLCGRHPRHHGRSFRVYSDSMSTHRSKGYSPQVRLELVVNGAVFDLAQAGPERGFVREPQDLPPCDGELTVYVDDETIRRRVRLLDGMSKESRMVRFGEPQ